MTDDQKIAKLQAEHKALRAVVLAVAEACHEVEDLDDSDALELFAGALTESVGGDGVAQWGVLAVELESIAGGAS